MSAALNLGCVPVRASRSQRHMNPRSYLSPTTEGSTCLSSKLTAKHTSNRSYPLPCHSVNQSSQLKPLGSMFLNDSPRPAAMDPHCLVSQLSRQVLPETAPRKNTSVNMGMVYPLYYGTHFLIRPEMPLFPLQVPGNSNPIIVGTPIFPSIAELDSHEREEKIDFENNHKKSPEPGFDLSLRLGSLGGLCVGPEKADFDEIRGSDSSNSHNLSPKQKEFCFFPMEANHDTHRFGTRGWRFEGEGSSLVRKHKAPLNINMEDELNWSQQALRSNCIYRIS